MLGIVVLGFDFKAMSKYDARLKEWYERTNGGKLDEVAAKKAIHNILDIIILIEVPQVLTDKLLFSPQKQT
jgi:uncharacterized membrane protein (DUF373 family)